MALTMLVNLVTGVLIARTLGPAGRGELTAIMSLPALVGWAFGMGAATAIQYHHATHPEDAPRLLGTWLTLALPLGLLGLLFGQFILHLTFAAQSAAALHLAQLYLATVILVVVGEVNYGFLLGDLDFLFLNLMRMLYPGAVACAYVSLWGLHWFSVPTALMATAFVGFACFIIGLARVWKRHGIGRPSARLGLTTVWYGLRGHGTTVSSALNERLDLLIVPAFLGASNVGIYAVATNVSWLIFSLAGALNTIVMSAALRQKENAFRTVIYSFHVTTAIALGGALCVGLFADLALQLVYGKGFAASALPLRLLLPGTVLYVGAWTLGSGLNAANRPFTGAFTHALGTLVTVPGLLIFLRSGGVAGAAAVTSASYAVVFVASIVLYGHVMRRSARDFLPTAAELSHMGSWIRSLRVSRGLPEEAATAPSD